MSFFLAKRLNASTFFLDFLTWAILSLLGTRLFLELTGYFTLGRGNWHVAHVLWGGLFMLLAIIIVFVFYGKNALRYASIFAGVGWGLFIDEIGKYLTRDNNYWFRPAIIFIYISFILLFLLYRFLEKKGQTNRRLLWHDLLEDCQDLADDDLEKREKKELLSKIKKLDTLSPSPAETKLLLALKNLVLSTPALSDKYQFSLGKFIASFLQVSYTRLFKKKLIFNALLIYSVWYIADKITDLIIILSNPHKLALIQTYYSHYDFFSQADVYMISLKFIIEIVVASFYLAGLAFWLRKKVFRGIKFYQYGLLINIFIGSFFKFYFEQFSGVFSLILALLVWYWLRSYYQERLKI